MQVESMRNIELKCELREPDLAPAICRRLGAVRIAALEQRDTYFRVAHGRLKIRETSGEPTEWIRYDREDSAAPKVSRFTIYSEEEAREQFGAIPLPVWVVVDKKRELWMKDGVRIHLDMVQGLGHFIEFEALVTRDKNMDSSREALRQLHAGFAPILGEAISGSYADLVAAQTPA